MNPKVLTASEVADRLGCSRQYVHQALIKPGKLRATMRGVQYLIEWEDFSAYVAGQAESLRQQAQEIEALLLPA